MDKSFYIRVLECVRSEEFLVSIPCVLESRDYELIGESIINKILDEIPELDYVHFKKIICMSEYYTKEQYQNVDEKSLCNLVCERVIGFQTYPVDEFESLYQNYLDVKNKYNEFLNQLNTKIDEMDALIKVDEHSTQDCGTLIKRQRKLREINNSNKSVLKDLKKIEDEYNALFDEIQEKYVYQEMLKFARSNVKNYFHRTIFLNDDVNAANSLLKTIALEAARENNLLFKDDKVQFLSYKRCLDSWENATKSLYKPFFLIKMRKSLDDIEDFYLHNANTTYFKQEQKLLQICSEKRNKIIDSDLWIDMKTNKNLEYLSCLKEHISQQMVLQYIKTKISRMFCLQKRKMLPEKIIEAYETKNYLVFNSLVVVQIEGIFYDLFIDANIQNRLDGRFDLFEKDDLRAKLDKNINEFGLIETTLYFRYYFNNLIRNNVAHGRNSSTNERAEELSHELLLDFQYVIYLMEKYSDTNAAVKYICNTEKWLETSFSGIITTTHVYERLLNSLNNNVLTYNGRNEIEYVDSHQNLYWIFNPYYDELYEYEGIRPIRDKIRHYLTSNEFWSYVLEYLNSYNENEYKEIEIKHEFKSRVKAIQAYVARNNISSLDVICEVIRTIDNLGL